MPKCNNPAKALHFSEKTAACDHEGPRMPAGFAASPYAKSVMEEMVFNHRFSTLLHRSTNMVGVNEVGAVAASGHLRRVGTSSLRTCIGLAVIDRERKVGGVAHVPISEHGPLEKQVARMLSLLIDMANMVGGRKYHLYAFNVINGERKRNDELSRCLEQQVKDFAANGVVTGFEHREERHFILDAGTGRLFTGSTGHP